MRLEKYKREETITVLLTRRYDNISNLIYWISGCGYTHASIALDNKYKLFYSFNFNGFCIEDFSQKKLSREKNDSLCYHIKVSEATYNKIYLKISDFIEQKMKYKYSKIGLVLCVLGIPHKIKNHYFCSQFVAELLSITNEIKLKKRTSLYLPNQLVEELENQLCPYKKVYGIV
jgi:hypothetical protein